jgi:lipopolysaccharide/colanic/teichoic acid biosynthesis glycosyltransferase
VGGDVDFVSADALDEVRLVCARWNVPVEFVPQLMGLRSSKPPYLAEKEDRVARERRIAVPRYLSVKPFLEFFAALGLSIALLPLFLLVAGLVAIDLGTPVLFWQQRTGLRGRTFLLHKFRTLRPPFDAKGYPVSERDRLSTIGRLLRKSRLDELPQLLNVLSGEMALIGPRPLLPEDQPKNVAVRLMVRPGITGWAQVNGGKMLTPEEKHALDEWYIRNASFWLDLRILAATARVVFTGERQAAQFKGYHGRLPETDLADERLVANQ